MIKTPKGQQIDQLVGANHWYIASLAIPSGGSVITPLPAIGRVPGGDDDTKGVFTVAPYNKLLIRYASNYEAITDSQDRQIYARLTESSGVWTITFFIYDAGSETAYDFSTDLYLDGNPNPNIGSDFQYLWCESVQLGNIKATDIVGRTESMAEGPGGDSNLDNTKVTTITSASTELIDSIPISESKSVQWFVELYDSTASKVQSFELLVNDNVVSGSDLSYQQYAINGAEINYSFSTQIDTGNIKFSITNNESNSITVKSKIIKL